MDFEKRRIELIMLITAYWKVACEFADDQVYEEVKKVMENAIFSETEEQLIAVSDRLAPLGPQINLAEQNSLRQVQWNWENRKRGDNS